MKVKEFITWFKEEFKKWERKMMSRVVDLEFILAIRREIQELEKELDEP